MDQLGKWLTPDVEVLFRRGPWGNPDGRHSKLLTQLAYQDSGGSIYRAPVGTESDGASIPQELWSTGLAPFGQYWMDAYLHDSAYQGTLERQMSDGYWLKAMLTKPQCDDLLLDAMKTSGVEVLIRDTIYEGVKLGGWRAFREDRSAK